MTKAMIKISETEALDIVQHIRQVATIVNTSHDGSTIVLPDTVVQWMRDKGYMIFISVNRQTRGTVVDLVPERMRHRLWDMSHA